MNNFHQYYEMSNMKSFSKLFINKSKRYKLLQVGWMKADDQTILALHTRVITHNPRITVGHDNNLRTWQLRIRQLKESDRGCYMCQINTGEMKKQYGCIDVHGK